MNDRSISKDDMRPTIFITGTIDEGGIDIQRVTEHRRLPIYL